MQISKLKIMILPYEIRTKILSYLSASQLFELSSKISKQFKLDCDQTIQVHFSTIFNFMLNFSNTREIWEAVLRYKSKKLKNVFRLLHWSIGILHMLLS